MFCKTVPVLGIKVMKNYPILVKFPIQFFQSNHQPIFTTVRVQRMPVGPIVLRQPVRAQSTGAAILAAGAQPSTAAL